MLSRFLWWRRYLLPQSTTVHHSHQLSVPSLLSLKMNHQINLPSPIEHPMCVYHQLKSGQKMQTLASQKSFICTTLLFFIMIIIYSCSLDFEYQKRYEALYHFNYSNRTVQSTISFTKITYHTAKIFHEILTMILLLIVMINYIFSDKSR